MDDPSKKRLLRFALDLADRLRCRAEAWRQAPDMLRANGDGGRSVPFAAVLANDRQLREADD